ncbi:SDR family NAD(P)-dependent oxidoreductase [Actinomycetospora chiangmaiensis]|uniref:SDR family NAD(P)-dependent oxidoreductase n=1 Tax=Actinomycetospora chiangmaiensis TaxID=402650 RepID=UPI00036A2402|nr:SDR family NAD(P)-dependent oxidoreductase [Actinomycetospora chiangmaiensis]
MTSTSRPGALVLGASRGLGLLVATELGRAGYDLAVAARSADDLEAARPELEATGARVSVHPSDLAERDHAEACVDAAEAALGGLDVVVACAGVISVGPVEALTSADVVGLHDAVFRPVAYPVLRAAEAMRRRGSGRIGIVSSVGGAVPVPHLLPYTAGKFAVRGFSEALRTELAPHGITVTTVMPGLLRTGSPRQALVAGDREAEYRWFAALDSLPVLSTSAPHAARSIVAATLAGRAERFLTPAAMVGARLHGVAPGLTTRLAGLLARVLPGDGDDVSVPRPGWTLPEQPPWFRALTTLTRRAEARYQPTGPRPDRRAPSVG